MIMMMHTFSIFIPIIQTNFLCDAIIENALYLLKLVHTFTTYSLTTNPKDNSLDPCTILHLRHFKSLLI